MNGEFSFSGSILSIFFSNPSNFYKVLLLEITDTDSDFSDSEIVITGTMGDVIEGEVYTFRGSLTQHPKYGMQLTATSYEKSLPTSNAGLVKFFASPHFPGVGKATAERIVAAYPEDTIDAILQDPRKLTQVLSAAKREVFLQNLKDTAGQDMVLARLAKYNLPTNLNLKIIEEYGEEALDVVETKPYRLVEDIQGIGFKLADGIAAQLGIAADDAGRIRAALIHSLMAHCLASGDTYVEHMELIKQAQYLLEEARRVEVPQTLIEPELVILLDEGSVKAADQRIFDNSLYYAEERIAANLLDLMSQKPDPTSRDEILKILSEVEAALQIDYDDQQEEAIIKAIQEPLLILTGGPGTGKSTIVKGLLEVYSRLNIDFYKTEKDLREDIILAAPTGRAARRLSELTDYPAATIHRQLGLMRDEDKDAMGSELEGALLIVDEFSMVDTWLANKLFAAIPPGMKVLLVGDSDQLPSVSPGQVFADLLKVPQLPSVRLEKIYRQSNDSTITELAYTIKSGVLPPRWTEKQADRSFFAADSANVPHLVEQIANSWKSRGNPSFELQILAPMYRGTAGIDNLNHVLQEVFNPASGGPEFRYKNLTLRKGDKILHLVNDAEAGVFNGDLGYIVDLVASKYTESKQDELTLNFDGIELVYPRADWYKLTLAYAISIHKSQGSEFQTVVLPLVSAFSRMLQRNLLYTAVTRAKKSLILLGEPWAFDRAVANVGSNRQTFLVERMLDAVPSSVKTLGATTVRRKSAEVVSSAAVSSKAISEDLPAASQVVPGSAALTTALIENGDLDPLIGLEEADFSIFKK